MVFRLVSTLPMNSASAAGAIGAVARKVTQSPDVNSRLVFDRQTKSACQTLTVSRKMAGKWPSSKHGSMPLACSRPGLIAIHCSPFS